MGRKDRKQYSKDFKMEAVRRTFEPGKTTSGVARELDIPLHQLYRWRDDVANKQDEAFPGTGKASKTELEQLRRENKRLREERDILKKSLIFFAKDHERDMSSSENLKENLQ